MPALCVFISPKRVEFGFGTAAEVGAWAQAKGFGHPRLTACSQSQTPIIWRRRWPQRRRLRPIWLLFGGGSVMGKKVAIESPCLLADRVAMDPDLTMTLPAAVAAATGIDAVAHWVEALTSRKSHPLIDTYAPHESARAPKQARSM